jgi:hypothetical protein
VEWRTTRRTATARTQQAKVPAPSARTGDVRQADERRPPGGSTTAVWRGVMQHEQCQICVVRMASMAASEGAVPATVPAASTLVFSAALAVVWVCSARVLSDAVERLGLAGRACPVERLATSIAASAAKPTAPAT